jgi:Flp pilus assembly protein TadG
MSRVPLSLLRRLSRDRAGTSAVEMAIVTPVLFAALVGIFDLSRAFSARIDLVQAASRSAELATALGQVRTDYSFLQSEAVAAAAASGQTGATAAIDAWLECNGVRQPSINGVCPQGQAFARYVSVRVNGRYVPVFPAAGLISPGGVPITGNATVRIQ